MSLAQVTAAPTLRPSAGWGRRRLALAWLVACTLAALPAARMIALVLDGSALQHSDYWMMLPTFTDRGGGLDVDGLFVFQNQHPVVVPKLLYWANVQAFSGSNITLGLAVVALGAAQVVLIALLLRGTRFAPLVRMALVVAASALLFGPVGSWNFVRSMSGAAWLGANAFALLAILLRSRDHRLGAGAAAVLASASYATGIAVWPALVVVGLARPRLGRWWSDWPYAVGAAATFAWYRIGDAAPANTSRALGDVVEAAGGLAGFALGLEGAVGRWVGYAALLTAPALAALLLRSGRAGDVAGWLGVATFGWVATCAVAYGRHVFLFGLGEPNRSVSVGSLLWIGLLGLLAAAVCDVARPWAGGMSDRTREVAGSLAVLAAALFLAWRGTTAGADHVTAMRAATTRQDLGAIALRHDLTDSSDYLIAFGRPVEIGPVLEEMGHYPFDGSGDLDCGLVGERLAPAATEATARPGGIEGGRRLGKLERGIEVSGWMGRDERARCIVVTDGAGEVIGAAVPDRARSGGGSPGQPLVGVAMEGADRYRAHVVPEGSSEPQPLAEVLDGAAVGR